MTDGLQWLEDPVPLPGGYCTIFARGIDPEDLVRRLVPTDLFGLLSGVVTCGDPCGKPVVCGTRRVVD
ncbi:hypothetical protein ACFVYV_50650 [Streptomyces mirabilis]|uniref:hypothetical protein n=1 Tax=Streptomyces mirabilis TaxID=68239 RepID=UPI0036D9227D